MNKRYELGLLILRLVLGITFLLHGLNKFQSGIGNIAGWFESIGVPSFVAYATATIEVVGGTAMILGLGTQIVSVLFAIVMLGALVKVKLPAGFMGSEQMAGYELELILLVVSVCLAITGSRLLAVDRLFSRSKNLTP